jgi:hypothetical protein
LQYDLIHLDHYRYYILCSAFGHIVHLGREASTAID